jgi:peptidoglycan/LPS O-acetylase OafA/YrhL
VTNVGWFILGPRAFNSDVVNVGPLWSSIEEHFYLIWPAIVLFMGRVALARICVGLVISAIVVRCLAWAFLPADAMP